MSKNSFFRRNKRFVNVSAIVVLLFSIAFPFPFTIPGIPVPIIKIAKAQGPYSSVCPGGDITISASITWSASAYNGDEIRCNNITIDSGKILTVTPKSATENKLIVEGNLVINGTLVPNEMDVQAAGNVNVNTGGKIDVSATSASGLGNGANGSGTSGGGGGAYGGDGGKGAYATGFGGEAYGNIYEPEKGSKGGNTSYTGGYGGGLLKITATGDIINNGSILSNGGVGPGHAGGGSGGGIRLEANNIRGAGIISADGAGGTTGGTGGYGGGGRIAIYYINSKDFSGSINAKTGTYPSSRYGSAGTILFAKKTGPSTYTNKELIISNLNVSLAAGVETPFIWSDTYKNIIIENKVTVVISPSVSINIDGGTFSARGESKIYNNGAITSNGSGDTLLVEGKTEFYNTGTSSINMNASSKVILDGAYTIFEIQNDNEQNFGNLIIQNGAALTHSVNTQAVPVSLKINAASVDVGHESTINVSAKSAYGSGNGANGGGSIGVGAGGGAYGGDGGKGDYTTGFGGEAYGDIYEPERGSKGGNNSTWTGGYGGGLLKIKATGDIINNGFILSDGGAGPGSSGGGSGGGIRLEATNIKGAGTISIRGGDGTTGGTGGMGGGGRIAIYYTNSKDFYGPVVARGGFYPAGGARWSSPGTILFAKKTGPTTYIDKELIISNNQFAAISANNVTPITASDTFKNILVSNNSNVLINSGVNINIDGGTFEIDDSNVTNNGTVISVDSDDAFLLRSGTKFYNTSTGIVNMNSASSVIFDGANTYFENQNTSTLNLGNLSIQNNAELSHSTDNSLKINATNVFIDSLSEINATAKSSSGCGNGQAGGGGGGYGGNGGNYSIYIGGAACGSLTDPNQGGSKGGNTGIYTGGYGGGLIKITATEDIINNGSISATGGGGAGYSGGGSGGTIKLQAVNITGSGTINANGGGASAAGRGGGGRIALYYSEKSFNGSITVNPGSGGTGARYGSIYEDNDGVGTTVVNNSTTAPLPGDFSANTTSYLKVNNISLDDSGNGNYLDEGATDYMEMTITAVNSSGVTDTSFNSAVTISMPSNFSGQYVFSGCQSSASTPCTTTSGSSVTFPGSFFTNGIATVRVNIKDLRTSPFSGYKHHGIVYFEFSTSVGGYVLLADGYSTQIELEDGTPPEIASVSSNVFATSAAFRITLPSTESAQYQKDISGVVVVRRAGNSGTYSTLNLQNYTGPLQKLIGSPYYSSGYPAGLYEQRIINSKGRQTMYSEEDKINTNYFVVCVIRGNHGDQVDCLDTGLDDLTTYTYGFYTFDDTHDFPFQNEAANYSAQELTQIITDDNTPPNMQTFTATGDVDKITLDWTNPSNNVGHTKTIIVRKVGSYPTFHPTNGTDYSIGSSIADGEIIYASTNVSNLTFDDTNVTSGVTYYYEIFTQFVGNYYPSPTDELKDNAAPLGTDIILPVITINFLTKTSNLPITDTTITVTDDVAIDPSGISISGVAYTNLICVSNPSPTQVDCTLTITSSGDLQVDATDNAGNPAIQVTELDYIVDILKPNTTLSFKSTSQASYVYPPNPNGNDPWYTENVGVKAGSTDPGGSGIAAISYRTNINGGPFSSWTTINAPAPPPYGNDFNTTFTVSDEGVVVIQVKAEDNIGNEQTVYTTQTIQIDKTNPTVPILNSLPVFTNAGTPTSPFQINWAAGQSEDPGANPSGIAGYKLYRQKDGGSFSQIGPNPINDVFLNQTGLVEGSTYDYYLVAIDAAGNESGQSAQVSTTIDRVGPNPPTLISPPYVNDITTFAKLIWSGAMDLVSGLKDYDIFRTNAAYPTPPSDPMPANLYQTSILSSPYTDTPISSDTIYKYRARGVDNAFNPGDLSNTTTTIVDDHDPTTTATLPSTDPPYHNTWYNSDFVIRLDATDNTGVAGESQSGIRPNGVYWSFTSGGPYNSCTNPCNINITNEGDPITLYFYSEDLAGNIEEPEKSTTFKIDKTAPSVNSSSAAYDAGTDNITLNINLSDALSGVDSSSVKATLVGATTIGPLTLNDLGGGNWGIVDGPYIISGPYAITYEFSDLAGNTNTFISALDADGIPPVITINSNNPVSKISNSFVSVDFTITDNNSVTFNPSPSNVVISGVSYANLNCVQNGIDQVDCTVQVTSSGDMTIQMTDDNGNLGSVIELDYIIDNIVPVSTIGFKATSQGSYFDPPNPDGANSWYINDVDVRINATDNLSGVSNTYYQLTTNGFSGGLQTCIGLPCTFSLSTGGTTVINFYSNDNAGNIETAQTRTINIDKQNPTAGSINSLPAFSNAGTASDPLTISWDIGTDPLPGSDIAYYNLYRDAASGVALSDLYQTGLTDLFYDELSLTDGTTYYYKITTVDNAGRESAFSNEVFVTIDHTGPEPATISPCYPWNNTTTNNLTWTQSTITGSPVDYYNLYRSNSSYPAVPANPTPPAFETPITPSGPPNSYTDDDHTLGLNHGETYRYGVTGTDTLSNEGAVSGYCDITIDLISPITTSVLSGLLGDNGWYRFDVVVSLNAQDLHPNPPPASLSGIKADSTKYSLASGGPYTSYNSTGPFMVSSEGVSKAYFYSEDNAENIESETDSGDIKIDKTLPEVTGSNSGYDDVTKNVTASMAASDSVSGVASVAAQVYDVLGNAEGSSISLAYNAGTSKWEAVENFPGGLIASHTIRYTVTDIAGNVFADPTSYSLVPSGFNTAPQIQNLSAVQILDSENVFISFDLKDDEQNFVDITGLTYINGPIACSLNNISGDFTFPLPVSVSVNSVSWSIFNLTWDAGTDCPGETSFTGQIELSIDDLESLSNTNSAVSAPFLLDTENPNTAPGDLNQDSKTQSLINVVLDSAAIDTGGVKEYKIYYKEGLGGVTESDTLLATIPSASYVLGDAYTASGLDPDTDYTFNIWAYDFYGHKVSAGEITITTDSAVLSMIIESVDVGEVINGENINALSSINSINFGEMEELETKTSALKITGDTSNLLGYNISMFQNHDLESNGNAIAKFDANWGDPVANSNPLPWIPPSGKGFFGYSTTCATLDGDPARFVSDPLSWASLSEVPGQVAKTTSSGPLTNHILFRIELGEGQESGIYTNTITLQITDNF